MLGTIGLISVQKKAKNKNKKKTKKKTKTKQSKRLVSHVQERTKQRKDTKRQVTHKRQVTDVEVRTKQRKRRLPAVRVEFLVVEAFFFVCLTSVKRVKCSHACACRSSGKSCSLCLQEFD